MKNQMIAHLKEINKSKDLQKPITHLIYNERGDYVQDFSFFTSLKYMSEELLSAIQNGQTLTTDQELELQSFVIEKSIVPKAQKKNQTLNGTIDFLLDEMCKVLSYKTLFGELTPKLEQELLNLKNQLYMYST